MSGPPNKWFVFATTPGMTVLEFNNALNSAVANGYTGQAISVPIPGATDGTRWVAIAGYGSTTED